MKIKSIYLYYKATFPGEIFEKLKRKFLIKTGLYELLKNNKKVNLTINKNFINRRNSILIKQNLNYMSIFEKKIKINEYIEWYYGENKKKWYEEKVYKYGDIKYIWEKNRLQFLLPLSLNNEKNKAMKILDAWNYKNEFDLGVNWYSNLEVAIRGISILNFVNSSKEKIIFEKYKNIIYLHGKHLFEDIDFSRKCIPNNHLVGEAASLYCISRFLDLKKWELKSKDILIKSLSFIQEDGTYKEASLSYHRFILQMYIMVYMVGESSGDTFIRKEIIELLKKSYIFFKSIEKPNFEYPDFGDNDQGYFYQVFLNDSFENFVKSLGSFLKINSYFGEIQILEKIYNINIENKEVIKENIFKNIFEVGRYFIIKDKENYLFCNNQEQIYHSHSDGLSIELMLLSKDILIDSGTFSYNLDKKKRAYYRGTRAHNTVFFGENQTKEIGSFRWIEQAVQKMTKRDKFNFYGTIKLLNKQEHTREVKVENNFELIKIIDSISNSRTVELNWHFAKDINLKKINNNKFKILEIDYEIEIVANFNHEIEITTSSYSPSYGVELERINMKINNNEIADKYEVITIFRRRK